MTLFESIVAFVVLALVGIACLDLSRGAIALQRSSAEWTQAVAVGEAALAAASVNAPADRSAMAAPPREMQRNTLRNTLRNTQRNTQRGAKGTMLVGVPQVSRRMWQGDVEIIEVAVPMSDGRIFAMYRLVSRRSGATSLAAGRTR